MISPRFSHNHNSQSFTLIELLIVIGILAILMSITVITLNPAEMLKKTRDTHRISDLATISKIISLYQVSNPDTSLGIYKTVYVSLPAVNTNCSDLNLPALPSGYSYKCSSLENYRKINGTGWLPINFTNLDIGAPISSLPVDPTNQYNKDLNAKNDFFYTYTVSADGHDYEINTKLESNNFGFTDRDGYPLRDAAKDNTPINDGGDNGLYEKGSNLTLMPDSGGLCPSGMVWVPAPGRFCIDKYEASYAVSATKPDGTTCNSDCPISQYNTPPWTSVKSPAPSQTQAISLCQSMGKDLPTDFEWWLAAAGTPDPYNFAPSPGAEPCHIWNTGSWPYYSGRKPNDSIWARTNGWGAYYTAAINTGTASNCKSIIGAMDMIGNVCEWTNNTLTCDGVNCVYQGITMPSQGYIASINNEGIPLTTGSANFSNDYYWQNTAANTYAFLRGGTWSNAANAGRFSLGADRVPGYNTARNFGFRCLLR